MLALIQIASYFVTLLLAGYLLNRSHFHPIALATSGALISFAIIQADFYLTHQFSTDSRWLTRLLWAAYPLPVICWLRVAILLKPSDTLDRIWWTLLLPIAVSLIFGGWISDFSIHPNGSLIFTLYNVLISLATLALLHQTYHTTPPTDRLHPLLYWLRAASLAYTGGMILLGWLDPALVFALVILDLILLGILAIIYDALSEGQSAQRDLAAIVIKTALFTLVLIVPWWLAAHKTWSLPLALALFCSLGTLALGTTLLDEIEKMLDRWVFKASENEQQARAALRTLIQNTARQPDSPLDVTTLDPAEFTRLTRRALSHLPNLPRLAASPLTNLKLITERVGPTANTLERANALRTLLAECIETLRPHTNGDYGTTDEWRFYNALYYPYVAGISPYKHTIMTDNPATRDILNWFRTLVPPRTLYNWQNKAAELIAKLLLERESASRF